MTKTWEREFAVSRMREDPTISYRPLAKVLDCSDATIRQWRDEEGIQPSSQHGAAQEQDAREPWRAKSARPVALWTQDHDDDGYKDDDDLPETELPDEENDEEEFELDDTPAASHAASLVQTWETIGKLGGLRLGLKASSTPCGARRSRTGASTGIASTTPEDPGTRLRAITGELDAGSPRGAAAVKLLVEAAPYLTGGVTALRQYCEAQGCDPEDVAAAERAVVGKGEGLTSKVRHALKPRRARGRRW